MGVAKVEVDFLKLDQEKRKEKLVELLRVAPDQILQINFLAEDIGIDPEIDGWTQTELGKAMYTALRQLAQDGKVNWAQDQLVYLTVAPVLNEPKF